MKASDAHAIAEKAIQEGEGTVVVFDAVMNKIRQTAELGMFHLYHPFSALEVPNVLSYSKDIEEAVLAKLVTDGFEIIRHPGFGNATDPREGPYLEIKW